MQWVPEHSSRDKYEEVLWCRFSLYDHVNGSLSTLRDSREQGQRRTKVFWAPSLCQGQSQVSFLHNECPRILTIVLGGRDSYPHFTENQSKRSHLPTATVWTGEWVYPHVRYSFASGREKRKRGSNNKDIIITEYFLGADLSFSNVQCFLNSIPKRSSAEHSATRAKKEMGLNWMRGNRKAKFYVLNALLSFWERKWHIGKYLEFDPVCCGHIRCTSTQLRDRFILEGQ